MANGISIKDRAPVSVIIPSYNCADTIERAIKSVASQTLLPAEVLIIDDGSDEKTKKAIESVKDEFGELLPINVITFSSNRGPSAARNAGWDAATQPYIAFLDADDSWHPQKIELQYKWMKEHPEVAMCGHGWEWRKSKKNKDIFNIREIKVKRINLFELLVKHYFLTPTVMMKKNLPFRFDNNLRHTEDHALWLQMVGKDYLTYYLEPPLAYLHKAPYGEGGLTRNLWAVEKNELKVFKKLRDDGIINHPVWIIVSIFSILKFIRRLIIVTVRKVSGWLLG